MGPKNKAWLITFETYNSRGDAIPAIKEMIAENEKHARSLFINEHCFDGMTYRILLVTEVKE